MAKTRKILERLGAVRNIRTVTKTMEMVAAARFMRSHQAVQATRRYAVRLTRLLADMARRNPKGLDHPLLRPSDVQHDLLLVLTSDRGLCGGYNSSVIQVAMERLGQLLRTGYKVSLRVVGKRGVRYFEHRAFGVDQAYVDVPVSRQAGRPHYGAIVTIADAVMDDFRAGKISGFEVAYMQFLSSASQRPAIAQVLPLEGVEEEAEEPEAQVPYEFMPDSEEILNELLPAAVRMRLYQCFVDALVAEQAMRIKAMGAATESADEMIADLRKQYNRTRQAQITTELAEIMGGREGMD